MSIKFTKQADGTFVQSGDLPLGTRTVRVLIDGAAPVASIPHPAKEHVKLIAELVSKPQFCPAKVYELIPVDVDSAERVAKNTANLVKARAKKEASDESDVS